MIKISEEKKARLKRVKELREKKEENVAEVTKKEDKEVKEVIQKNEKTLPLVIERFYDRIHSQWIRKIPYKCCNCGAENEVAYELIKRRNGDKKFEFICYECLKKAGYKRRFGRMWIWKKEGE